MMCTEYTLVDTMSQLRLRGVHPKRVSSKIIRNKQGHPYVASVAIGYHRGLMTVDEL